MKNILTFLLTLLFFIPIQAQETTGSLQGVLKDSEQHPIPFATIVLTDMETNFTYGAISQESGFYQIHNLPPGNTYKATISFIGYQTIEASDLSINLGSTTVKNFTLLEGSTGLDEVVVTAEATPKKNGK